MKQSNNKAAKNENKKTQNQNQNRRICQLSLRAKIIITVATVLLVVVALSVGIAVGISQSRRSKGEKQEDTPQEQSIEDIVQELNEEFQNLSPDQIIPRPVSPLPRPIGPLAPPQIVITPPTVVTPTPAPPQSTSLDPGSNAWLTAHNDRRSQHCGTPPLRWSPALVKSAQAWANRCQFEHSTRGGENLYMISGGFQGVSAEKVLYQFYDNEITKYDFSNPDFSFETGHFTQVVWKNTEQVGCATKDCGSFALVVCHYDPVGNVKGRFGAQVGNVCN